MNTDTKVKTAEEVLRKPAYASLRNLVLICDAMEEYASQFKSDWIPVSEREPVIGRWCLVYSWRGVLMASFWKSEWRVYNHEAPGNYMGIDGVTHWQPLPKTPLPSLPL